MEPGRIGLHSVSRCTRVGLFLAVAAELLAQFGLRVAEDGDGEQRGVDRARLADGERAHRNAAGHLYDGEQRIHALQRVRFHGHAEHRHQRLRGHHAGQMRGAARSGDDHLDAALFGGGGVLRHPLRRAVRGNDAAFVRDVELLQRLRRVLHGLPIGFAAHDDADHGFNCRTKGAVKFCKSANLSGSPEFYTVDTGGQRDG